MDCSPPTVSAADTARLVAQVVDYAIISLDPDGVITSWNAGATRLKGYSEDEALGRHFSMFYPEADRDANLPLTLLTRALAGGSVQHSGWRIRADGSRFWGDVVITALHDDLGAHSGFAKVTRDLTVEHELELSLRRSEQRLRLLVEQVTEYAIIMLDRQGVIETWNSGAERLKGYSAVEVLGRHFSLFYTDSDRSDGLPQRLLTHALEAGSVEHSGWRVRADGSRFWGDVIITALHDDAGVPIGFAKVTRDITARKRFEDARETFFDTFAHDFRAPVTAIAGFAEILDGATPQEQTAYIERIRLNARRLIDMGNELVEHSRVQTSVRDLDLAALDLHQVVQETVDGLGDGDRARVRVDVAHLRVLGDRAALERVLVNLLSNALRYSAGDTAISIGAKASAEQVRLTVADQGRGIDPADVPRIFDEFERGRLSADDGGTGLGLTSVKLLVERMGGHVTIASEPGVGTTVTVELSPA